LESAVVVPGSLNARAASYFEFAEQTSRLIPLAANAVKLAVLVGFFGREHAVLVPGAVDTMPATIPQGKFLAEQSGSIKVSLNGGAHHTVFCIRPTSPTSGLIVH